MTFAESMLRLLLAAAMATGLLAAGLRARRWPTLVAGLLGLTMTGVVADMEFHGVRTGIATSTLVATIGVGLVGGAVLLAVGLRGRRVGDHPFCRRCGFDLTGRPATSVACAECGSPLDGPRAIVVGIRQRRGRLVVAGLFALVLALAGSVPIGRDAIAWGRAYQWRHHWPESWLAADLRGSDATAKSLAYAELFHGRLLGGTLGPTGASALIDEGMTHFGGVRIDGFDPTNAAYLARDRWIAGTLDETAVRRAMRASLELRLSAAPTAARGHMLRYAIKAPDPKFVLGVPSFADRTDMLDNRRLGEPTTSTLDPTEHVAGTGDTLPLDARVPLGNATLTTRLTATITLTVPGRPTLVERRDLTLTATATIVEADAMRCPPITYASGATSRPSVPGNSLSVIVFRRDQGRSTFVIQSRAAGVILADAFVVTRDAPGDEVVRPIGAVLLDSRRIPVVLQVDAMPSEPFVLRLVPAPERGAELFNVVPIFGVPIDVPSVAMRGDAKR